MSLTSLQERVGEVAQRLLENRGAVALTGVAALVLWTIKDFLSWRSSGIILRSIAKALIRTKI
jgi:hypothetical protein